MKTKNCTFLKLVCVYVCKFFLSNLLVFDFLYCCHIVRVNYSLNIHESFNSLLNKKNVRVTYIKNLIQDTVEKKHITLTIASLPLRFEAVRSI